MEFVENKKSRKTIFSNTIYSISIEGINYKGECRVILLPALLSKEFIHLSNVFYFGSFFKYNEIIKKRDERMDDEIIYIYIYMQGGREIKYD